MAELVPLALLLSISITPLHLNFLKVCLNIYVSLVIPSFDKIGYGLDDVLVFLCHLLDPNTYAQINGDEVHLLFVDKT